jgi:tetratricopeptide (TPR) repeat protein
VRYIRTVLLAGVSLQAHPAIAADALKFGPPPAWVVPQAIPATAVQGQDRPAVILLHDQQALLEPGKISSYTELAFKIQKREGLDAGNISMPWNPATDTVTVNKLEIHRGNQVIDVLAGGQTFTTMRRESNLDLAMLDGILTANIQPEGLQQGDTVVLATTTEQVDPVLKGHVEANFAPWTSSQIGVAHVRLAWPSRLDLTIRKVGDLPAPQQASRDGRKTYELTMRDLEPVIAPKGAPVRYQIGRLGEATDFHSWADAAQLMIPLYREASVIPPSGPLRDEVEKIRKASNDPKLRAEQAVQLVQQRIRYVALLMGQGGWVPASSETTWSRRFGDCKAKTALLLGILHELGIEAEPVLVNASLGNAIADRLPMIGVFNHVLVRAHVGGKDYWLDGTRTGDTALEDIEVPDFGWGLPLIAGAQLVHMVPRPLDRPSTERHVDVDASRGAYAPASIIITEIYRGDSAVALDAGYSALSAAQRDEALRKEANGFFDGFQVSSSSVQFDKAKRSGTLVIKGTAKLNWRDGWFYIPTSSIAFNPDFNRPAGPLHDAPIAVNHPRFARDVATIKLPPGFAEQQKADAPVHETLAGVEYARTEVVKGDTVTVESSERSIADEVPYNEAVAAAARLKALNEDNTYLRFVANYRPTDRDVAALAEQEPGSVDQFVDRGNTLMAASKFDQAIADFTKALSFDPKNVTALADRGLTYVWMNKFDLADKDLNAAAAIEPENAIVHRARGLKAESSGDCAAAVDAYNRALKSEPRNGFALGHRSICENLLGRHSEALSDAKLALQMEPKWELLRTVRLDSFARLGQKDAAAAEAEKLVKDHQQTPTGSWIDIAWLYNEAGLQAEAFAAIDRALAIKLEPSTYVSRAAMRPSADVRGRMADIEAALRLEPMNTEALKAKADLLADQGDLKGALAIYDNALKTSPGSSLALPRGILLFKLGRRAEGERALSTWRKGALTARELNELCWEKATAGILL